MKPMPYQASIYEQQLAMAILAHTARHDDDALTVSLDLLADLSSDLHPICVLTALLDEFQRGMDMHNSDELAGWFSEQALSLAANDAAE